MCGVRWLLPLFAAMLCRAHVGSPDVFYEGGAGPYQLLVAVRPPSVIPGIARVEVRSLSPDVQTVRVVPLPLTGEGAKHPPAPDVAQRSKSDAQFYTGSLWMMGFGSWQVRVEADGARGRGRLSVPVPALASNTAGMRKGTGAALFAAMLFLVVGLIGIVGAGVREARLPPGVDAPPAVRKRSYVAMAITAALVAGVLFGGAEWWASDAAAYRDKIYKPLQMTVALDQGNRLNLELDPGWLSTRRLNDLIPDHGHLMHLFAFRMPEMDRMWHLHPERSEAGTFEMELPSMPTGHYKFFADIVHDNGLAETATTETDWPAIEGPALSGDDAAASAPPLSGFETGNAISELPHGYRMVWLRDAGPLVATRMTLFRFRLEDAGGRPARNVQPYMGMAGHAEFVRTDGKVFAHVHPAGSVSMATLEIARPMAGMHSMAAMESPETVTFPYGFPGPGRYRIFVQMKRAGEVETGVFDAEAGPDRL